MAALGTAATALQALFQSSHGARREEKVPWNRVGSPVCTAVDLMKQNDQGLGPSRVSSLLHNISQTPREDAGWGVREPPALCRGLHQEAQRSPQGEEIQASELERDQGFGRVNGNYFCKNIDLSHSQTDPSKKENS